MIAVASRCCSASWLGWTYRLQSVRFGEDYYVHWCRGGCRTYSGLYKMASLRTLEECWDTCVFQRGERRFVCCCCCDQTLPLIF